MSTAYIDKVFEIVREKDFDKQLTLAAELCDIVRPMSVNYQFRWGERLIICTVTTMICAFFFGAL